MCYLTLHVSTALRCHLQGSHLCKTAARCCLDSVGSCRGEMLGTIAVFASSDLGKYRKNVSRVFWQWPRTENYI